MELIFISSTTLSLNQALALYHIMINDNLLRSSIDKFEIFCLLDKYLRNYLFCDVKKSSVNIPYITKSQLAKITNESLNLPDSYSFTCTEKNLYHTLNTYFFNTKIHLLIYEKYGEEYKLLNTKDLKDVQKDTSWHALFVAALFGWMFFVGSSVITFKVFFRPVLNFYQILVSGGILSLFILGFLSLTLAVTALDKSQKLSLIKTNLLKEKFEETRKYMNLPREKNVEKQTYSVRNTDVSSAVYRDHNKPRDISPSIIKQ